MQRSTYRFDIGLLQAMLLGALCGAMTSTVAAQEPVGQAEEPRDPTGGSVEDLSPVLAQVDVTPVARDEMSPENDCDTAASAANAGNSQLELRS